MKAKLTLCIFDYGRIHLMLIFCLVKSLRNVCFKTAFRIVVGGFSELDANSPLKIGLQPKRRHQKLKTHIY